MEGWGQECDAAEGRGGRRECAQGTARVPRHGPTWHTFVVVLVNAARNQINTYTTEAYEAPRELHSVALRELFSAFSRGRPGRKPLRVWPKVVTFLASVPSFAYQHIGAPE